MQWILILIKNRDENFKILSTLFGIFLSLFSGEVVSRIYFFGSAAFSYSKTNSFRVLDNSGLVQPSKSKSLLYELIPDLKEKYKLVGFNTNEEGFRDYNHTPNNNKRKVAVIGDSFTMGTGVAGSEMYTKATENILNHSKNTYEVFNFGVSGYSLKEYLTILKNNALSYNPNLVVISFCAPNDYYQLGIDFTLDKFNIRPKANVFLGFLFKKLLIIKLKPKNHKAILYSKKHLNFINDEFQKLNKILNSKNIKGLIFYLDLIYDNKCVSQIKNS